MNTIVLEDLNGLKYERARMNEEALKEKIHTLCLQKAYSFG